MPRRLIYAPRARDDLEAVRRRLAMIATGIRTLQQSPCLWPVGQHRGVRELPCAGGYRVLYQVFPDTGHDATAGDVQVLRVFGPFQDRRGFGSGTG